LFCKTFRHDFFDFFCSVFELPSLRNTRKRDKINWNFCRFFGESFRHGLFVKICPWCFWTPLTEKRLKTY
jgi:hypothetical protein